MVVSRDLDKGHYLMLITEKLNSKMLQKQQICDRAQDLYINTLLFNENIRLVSIYYLCLKDHYSI